ncbi:hypothetical protein [Sphingobium aquiterrae]|uniref:hypothetical protein n=1 Tax=Sphingobium aquiterrae TaxID=2038656 RepID=UPI003018764A
MKKIVILAAFLAMGTVAHAKQRTVIEDLPKEIIDNNHVATVEVSIADTAKEKLDKIELKAAEKRKEAGLAPYDAALVSGHPSKDSYDTLPFEVMFPLVMQDVTHEWGLTEEKGTPITLRVTVETIKTANAAMAILLSSSSDELAGKVEVLNAQDGQSIGSFYVHVVNSHGGWGGMLMRGGGIREKLAEEFSLESARILTGSTKKDWKKRLKAREEATKVAAATAPAAAQ